jgi:protein-tyrosine phosphatase
MIKILFICHGNICRSTMAQSVMTYLVDKKGLSSEFHIESAATSREEIGSPPHRGTVEKLRQELIPVVPHRAVQLVREDYEKYDYIIGMDDANIHNICKILNKSKDDSKIHKLLDFTENGGSIADPWYTGNFDKTFSDVLRGCTALLDYITSQSSKCIT